MQLRWVKPSTDGYKIPHKGEVWLIDHEPTQGHELRSIHYFVIVTDKALNEKLGMALCCPMTQGGGLPQLVGTTVVLDRASTRSGNIDSVVLCHQIRALDLATQGARYHTAQQPECLDEVLACWLI